MLYEYKKLSTYQGAEDKLSFIDELNQLALDGWRVAVSSKEITVSQIGTLEHPFILLERLKGL